ncbi:MAG: SAM-dependent methyltransferase, partial [Candidatus Levybacteria bacterium CG10_big_fil_rev_8_21_14_0_10_36_7]
MTGSHVMNKKNSSSFRDPSGYLFYRNGTLYRNVDTSYRDHYEKLIRSDLYDSLVKKNLLIRHKEVD